MRHRIELPERLGTRFSVRDAAANGVGRRRHEARDLARPFRGVRSAHEPATFREHLYAYLPRLRAGQGFGGVTATRFWGLPHPVEWTRHEDLVIVVATEASAPPPRTRGVRGRRLARRRFRAWRIGTVPVIDPVAALFMCAGELDTPQLVVMIDAIVTTAPNYPGRHRRHPTATLEDIGSRLDAWGPFAGCNRVLAALGRAREDVESPKESETRLAITDAGLPEPVVQHEVIDHGRLVARVDLAYPERKIAIEYEGDGHRTDKAQWRRDIARQRELEALGWIVIRVTELDLSDGGRALVAAVQQALLRRRAR